MVGPRPRLIVVRLLLATYHVVQSLRVRISTVRAGGVVNYRRLSGFFSGRFRSC